MAQTQLNAEYNPKFTPSQSQDGLEMRWFDHRPSTSTGKETDHRASTTMAKEDFAILTTSMDGINPAMNVITDQINNHTSRVIKEMKEQTEKITKLMKEQTEKISKFLEERKTISTTYRKKELATSVKTRDTTHRTVLLADTLITKETQKTLGKILALDAAKQDTGWLSAP